MYKIPENMKSKYEFVTLAAKRAEQLQMGAPARVDLKTNKVTVLAQGEVARGLIKLRETGKPGADGAIIEEE